MVVQIIDVEYVTVGKAECHSPVCADRHRPEPFHFALEGMQPEAGQIHISCSVGCVEAHENITQLNDVFSWHSARVGVFVKAFQSSVADRPDHSLP